jgi:hypothetical protein
MIAEELMWYTWLSLLTLDAIDTGCREGKSVKLGGDAGLRDIAFFYCLGGQCHLFGENMTTAIYRLLCGNVQLKHWLALRKMKGGCSAVCDRLYQGCKLIPKLIWRISFQAKSGVYKELYCLLAV